MELKIISCPAGSLGCEELIQSEIDNSAVSLLGLKTILLKLRYAGFSRVKPGGK